MAVDIRRISLWARCQQQLLLSGDCEQGSSQRLGRYGRLFDVDDAAEGQRRLLGARRPRQRLSTIYQPPPPGRRFQATHTITWSFYIEDKGQHILLLPIFVRLISR